MDAGHCTARCLGRASLKTGWRVGPLGEIRGGFLEEVLLTQPFSFLLLPRGPLSRCPPPPLAVVSSVLLAGRTFPAPLLRSPGAAPLGWKAPH